MNEARIRRLLHELAEWLVPDDVDLYPAIRARVEARRKQKGDASPGQRTPRFCQSAGRRWTGVAHVTMRLGLAAVGIALLFGLAHPSAEPVAREVTGAVLQHAGVAMARPKPTTPSPTAGLATSSPLVSLAEAQRRVPFSIHQPAWLPRDLSLVGVAVVSVPRADGSSGPVTVVLSYRPRDSAPGSQAGELRLGLTPGPPRGEPAVDPSRAQAVVVSGQAATYVPGASEVAGTWTRATNTSTLVWTMKGDDVGCVLADDGLGLSVQEMVRVADSIQ